jgi:hypothetical protein
MLPTQVPAKPDSQTTEYSTDQLYLAGWLLVTQRLKYLGARSDSKTQGRFYFADPEQVGLVLEAEYLNSDPLVPIKRMRDILSLLRDQLRRGGQK